MMSRDESTNASAPTIGPPPLAPIQADERLELVDALRGFALLGILLVNMAWFAQPLATEFADLPQDLSLHDRLAEMAIEFFAEGKFYSLFSLLFGFGMAIQMGRAQSRRRSFVRTYATRLLVLLLFAVAHVALLWFGDILHAYAILGFVLLLFRNRRQRTLLIWAAVFLLGTILLLAGLVAISFLAQSIDPAAATAPASLPTTQESAAMGSQPASQEADEFTGYFRDLMSRERETYGSDSFARIVGQRAEDFVISSLLLLLIYPVILTMFLFGVWIARAGILHEPLAHRRWLVRAAIAGFGAGIPLNALHVWLSCLAQQEGSEWVWLAAVPVSLLAGPTLAIGYLSALALWFQAPGGHKALSLLAPAGRAALSNYLLQSLVCTTLCYGYGFGLFGKIGPLAGIGIALALFAAQTALSHIWLRSFRFGPAEWLWRSLTYGRIQPLRRG